MGTSYTWHPGTGRVTSLWPVPLPLEADELLSTWLVRAALSQGCDPLVLTGVLWPKWRVWTHDLDRGIVTDRLRTLARMSGIDVAALEAASLRKISIAIGTAVPNQVAVLPWVLALGSRNRLRHGGLQYCPKCFSVDKSPFYRLQWRLAWHSCCSAHNTVLRDSCCRCMAPLEPHRLSPLQGLLSFCSSCGYDLRTCSAMPADIEVLAFQNAADAVAKCGYGKYDEFKLSAAEWFALSRYFLMLVRVATRCQSSNLSDGLSMLGIEVKAMSPSVTGLAFELLPVGERAVLLLSASKLLAVGPKRLFEVAQASSMKSATLKQGLKALPAQILNIVEALPQNSRSRKPKNKTGESVPLSRKAVTRVWARLQRKMRKMS